MRMDPMDRAKDLALQHWRDCEAALERAGYSISLVGLSDDQMDMLVEELVPPEHPEVVAYKAEAQRRAELDAWHELANDSLVGRRMQEQIDSAYRDWFDKAS